MNAPNSNEPNESIEAGPLDEVTSLSALTGLGAPGTSGSATNVDSSPYALAAAAPAPALGISSVIAEEPKPPPDTQLPPHWPVPEEVVRKSFLPMELGRATIPGDPVGMSLIGGPALGGLDAAPLNARDPLRDGNNFGTNFPPLVGAQVAGAQATAVGDPLFVPPYATAPFSGAPQPTRLDESVSAPPAARPFPPPPAIPRELGRSRSTVAILGGILALAVVSIGGSWWYFRSASQDSEEAATIDVPNKAKKKKKAASSAAATGPSKAVADSAGEGADDPTDGEDAPRPSPTPGTGNGTSGSGTSGTGTGAGTSGTGNGTSGSGTSGTGNGTSGTGTSGSGTSGAGNGTSGSGTSGTGTTTSTGGTGLVRPGRRTPTTTTTSDNGETTTAPNTQLRRPGRKPR